ncbi:iron dicitrate transporter FecR [Bacteroidia bacterium]|nr:iron dicitrate transporter FecR [Bacteroidia bacterium]
MSDELSELKAIVNRSDNEELDGPLRELWMNDEYPPFLPTEKQRMSMIQRIKQAVYKESQPVILPLYKRFVRTLSRVAAVFIFVLLGGISIYLYRSNRNLTVYGNNEIVLNVGNGQEAGFILPDGTSVRLNSGSMLRYTNNFGAGNRIVNFSGEAFFDVKQDKSRPFIVSTKYMDIEVVGTTFNVSAFDSSDLVEMTLLTGSVKASSKKDPGYQVFVKPNEKVIYNISTGKLTVRETNVQDEMVWLNGEIVFKSEPLSNVLLKMERKYGVHILYEGDTSLLNDCFSGRVGKDSRIGDAMKILTDQYPLKYERKNDDTFVLSERKHK